MAQPQPNTTHVDPLDRGVIRSIPLLTALFAALLLASFLLQLPTFRVGDWQQIAIYDPGTVLKGDLLLAKGYLPTRDFGYTHGLLSLLYGRLGFALLGRTPAAFWTLTLLCELGMAWAFARIARALRVGGLAIALLIVALPLAVMPAYLTLTHPLEAMLISLALADQSEGRRRRSLALMTLCLFVKPSMAYVYGALLVGLIAASAWQRRRLTSFLRDILPAALTAILLFVALANWVGPLPVIKTLLPLTGAKTYAATGFGFFNTSGLALWWNRDWWVYLGTPVGLVLIGSATAAIGAVYAASRRLRTNPDPARERRWELLATIGALHTAFLLGFYGWTGSWTYYSYLLVWALVLAVDEVRIATRHGSLRPWVPRAAATLLIAAALLSHSELLVVTYDGWFHKDRIPNTALWIYPDQSIAWQHALARTGHRPTLFMTVGWVPDLPPNVSLPDAWFPEPGIPTASEVARVQAQADNADFIILWWEYRRFDLWNSADFAPLRPQFQPAAFEDFHWGSFIVLQRKASAGSLHE